MMQLDVLLAAVLSVQSLPGAACKGQHDLFDRRLLNDLDRELIERRALTALPTVQGVMPVNNMVRHFGPGR